MRYILTFFAAMALLTAQLAAWGAVTADISVPKTGAYYYWFTYADVNGVQTSTLPHSFKEKKTTADLPLVKDSLPKNTVLYVLNTQTGNEAIVAAGSSGTTHKFDLKTSDFNHVRRVRVEVVSESNSQPVAACIVKLLPKEKSTPMHTAEPVRTLDSTSGGIAEFEHVLAGPERVTVDYGDGKSASQDVDISSEREQSVPVIKVPVVGEVDTVQPAVDSAQKDPSAARGSGHQATQTVDRINFGSALMGIVLLLLVLQGARVALQRKGATVREALKRAGIDLPEENLTSGSAQPGPVAQKDPTICPFCGGKKDPTTGACACSLTGGGAVQSSSTGSGARLIATQGTYAGNMYPLTSDSVTLGREESNALAFPQDIAVSRRHASISGSGGQWTVRDEGSSNGTFVNGVRITEQGLHPGDEIQVGSTRLRFEL